MHHLTVIPTSVIDVEPQAKGSIVFRKGGGGFDDSSRKLMSAHPEETSRLVYELFLRDASRVFDPFAGFGQRAYWAQHYKIPYVGFDISQANINFAKENFGVNNTLADSSVEPLPVFDGVYTCPPYGNLEVYEGEGGIDKLKDYTEFLEAYGAIIQRIIETAPKGCRFCFQVGDWRAKGKLFNLTYDTERIFNQLGLTCFDKVVISRKKISKIKIMLPQAKRLGYTVKVHETLLVYEK